jgi:tetratricopeptide (TPR) repeat protein
MLSLVAALMVAAAVQSAGSERSRAEDLARAGRTEEAIALFSHIVEGDPADVEARLWLARLALRLGRTSEAEAEFRAVLQAHPGDVDARIGLGAVFTRVGSWHEALTILRETEPQAGENPDLLHALAVVYRRTGDDQRALEYFRRARASAPDDPDIASGYEAAARTYGHAIALAALDQSGAPGAELGSGALALSLRAMPRLHVVVAGRVQHGSGYSDALGGGGVLWQWPHATTIALQALAGPGNTTLATGDLSFDVVHYAGIVEVGGGVRRLSFAGADVLAFSPVFAWHPDGRLRLDSRYTYTRSSFADAPDVPAGDHSVFLRPTWQQWRRVAIQGSYAYGIESFEELTADRVGSHGTTTVAAGVRVDLRWLTRVTTTWEHQWRSNDTMIDRLSLSLVQSIP